MMNIYKDNQYKIFESELKYLFKLANYVPDVQEKANEINSKLLLTEETNIFLNKKFNEFEEKSKDLDLLEKNLKKLGLSDELKNAQELSKYDKLNYYEKKTYNHNLLKKETALSPSEKIIKKEVEKSNENKTKKLTKIKDWKDKKGLIQT